MSSSHFVQLSAINFGTQMGKAEQSRKGRLSEICLGRAAAHKAVFDLKRMGGGNVREGGNEIGRDLRGTDTEVSDKIERGRGD